jgi:transposase InsO family protein
MNDSTPKRQKRGPEPLSPNGVDRELARQSAAAHGARRRAKTSRGHTEWYKRERDWLKRLRGKHLRRLGLKAPLGEIVRWRVKAVRYYQRRCLRESKGAAAEHAAHRFKVSAGTMRRWAGLYEQGGSEALLPKPPGPHHITDQISLEIQYLVVALRRLAHWNEKRMAAELARRGLAQISHTSVGRIYARYHLPTRTYHTLAKCDGIPKQRYEKAMPNVQWHIDFLETTLADGSAVPIVAVLDDHSRFCLACQVVADMTAETAIRVVQQAFQQYGRPQEIVSDNGRAFTSLYQGVPTAFGLWLTACSVRHILITPYYPEGNGKAEAFVKILKHECLHRHFATQQLLVQALAEFVVYYNYYRLHGSLHYQPPATRYCGSQSPHLHGLLGIPALPDELQRAYPPLLSAGTVVTDYDLIKRSHALIPLVC